MKFLILAGASLLVGSLSQAAQIHCEGSYIFYHVTADAQSSGNHIVGDVVVKVNEGSVYNASMKATSSDVQEGQYIHATVEGKDGSGQLSVDYNADSKTYEGELNAATSRSNVSVHVVCTMTGSANPEFDLLPEEARFMGLYPVENNVEFK